jgi:CrcB protein
MNAIDMAWVGLGGGLGSLARWTVGRLVGERWHRGFPLGTVLINVSGALAIGYLATLFGVAWHDRYGTVLTAAVLTGFLGGYTTFSSMQLDATHLAPASRGEAAGYLAISTVAGIAAAALGVWIAMDVGS